MNINAPLSIRRRMGLEIFRRGGGEGVGEGESKDCVAAEDVPRPGFIEGLLRILRNWR